MLTRPFFPRLSGALFALAFVLFCSAYASAGSITINKTFGLNNTVNSIALGGMTTVYVTLQNNDTTQPATAVTFTDDLKNHFGGGILASTVPVANTCGGTLTLDNVNNIVTLTGGTIPAAGVGPPTMPSSCVVEFNIYGNKAGNSVNDIQAASVTTSLGGPPGDAQQTLSVSSANILVNAGPSQSVLVSSNTSPSPSTNLTFTVTNPVGTIDLTNVTLPIKLNTAGPLTFAVTSATITGPAGCAGTAGAFPAGLSGTLQFTGATIPAGQTCTVNVGVQTAWITATPTLPAVVNLALPASGIVSDQNITNANQATNQATFTTGNPTVSKNFNPGAIQAGGTSTLSINITNTLSTTDLTGSTLTDPLPAGLVVANPPAATTNCPGGSVAAANGATSVVLSGATITHASTCQIVVTVTSAVATSYTNIIPLANFTSTQVNNIAGTTPPQATLVVTGVGGAVSTLKSTSAAGSSLFPGLGPVVGPNTPFQFFLNFGSVAAGAFTNGQFTDTLPTGATSKLVVVNDAAHQPSFSGCGAAPPSIVAVDGSQSVSATPPGNQLTIAANSTCRIGFFAKFVGNTPGTVVPFTNTMTGVSFLNASSAPVGGANASTMVSELPVFTLANYSALPAPQGGKSLVNQPVTVQASIIDNDPTGALTDSNMQATFNLTPGKVQLAPSPNFVFGAGCPAGLSGASVTPGANGESFTLNIPGTISATCTFTYNVINEVAGAAGAGTYVPGTATYKSMSTGPATSTAATGTNAVTFSTTFINLSKSFTPNQIQAGATATAAVTISVQPIAGFAQTEALGVTVPDTLPANVSFAPSPNVTFSAGCQQAGQPAPTFVITSAPAKIVASSISLLAPTTCTINFDVTSSILGAPVNQIAIGDITSTSGITNNQPVSASLTVASGVAVRKTFVAPTVQIGTTTYIRFLLTNSAVGAPGLSGGTLLDNMPPSLVLAGTTPGPMQAGDPALCAGTIAGVVGASTYNLAGVTVPPLVGVTPGQCAFYVPIGTSGTAVPGPVTNTIAAGQLAFGGTSNQQGSSATTMLTPAAPPAAASVALSKSFSPASIAPGGSSTLTITVANTAAGAAALSSIALTDALPSNVTIASTPSAATTCTGGAVTAAAGGSNVALGGASLAANASCTITVSVTGTVPGTYTNTIPSNALTSAQGATNTSPATAALTIAGSASVSLAKSFAPASIAPGALSTLTLTVTNGSTLALSSLAIADALPANVTIAATPNAATTCSGATVTATAGAGSVALAGGTLAVAASCTVTVSVTGTVAGSYTNTIPASAITTAQGYSNLAPASAVLTIGNATAGGANVTLAKSFAPGAIVANGISTLTVSVNNTALGAVPLSSVALTDSLPANVTIAATPNPSTTCANATVSALAGAATVALTGASIPAFTSCTFSVSVTSATAGTYVNTIPAGALTSAQGATNAAAVQANLSVGNGSTVTISKVFTPAMIPVNGTSVLVITLSNTSANAVGLTGLGLSDTLPSGVVLAAVPGATTTCGAGVVRALSGASTLGLSGGSLAAGATCTITVVVTSGTPGIYSNNQIPVDSITSNQGTTNSTPANAALNVGGVSPVSVTKSFAPTLVTPAFPSTLTIALANTAPTAVPLTGVTLTDALPANLSIAATPNASTTCAGGTLTATAGATSVAIAGANLAPNTTCTVTVNVSGLVAGTYTNTIPAGAVGSAQAATNPSATSASLTIGPSLSVTKTSTPSNASVSPGQTVAYTIVVKNVGGQPETNATITDVLTNATLVPGSVAVNGTTAADAVITAAKPFGTIAAGSSATITYSAVVNATASANTLVTNSATAGGDQPCPAAACAASSPANTVLLPVLAVQKLIDGQPSESVVPGQTVTYTVAVTNTSGVVANNTTILDNVPAAYRIVPGSVTLEGVPLPAAVASGQTLTIPIATVAPNATLHVAFQVVVTSAAASAGNLVNVTTTGAATAFVSNTALANVVPATINLTKAANAATVTAGDRVDYTIVATPLRGIAYGAATIVDMLPAYERYAPGTARVNGKPLEPVVAGRTLTWTLPSLAAAQSFTYATVVTPGAPQNGTLTNTVNVSAVAPGGAGFGRGSASASVLIVGSTFGSCYPITGRVYLDLKGSGRFEDPDVGLGAVHIFLDNGESVTTDATGRYDFPCVHPGMHALRLDATSLPPGAVPYDDRNIDSEKSTRRLVHRIFDDTIIEDINFAVTGKLVKP